ncbi:YppG family protein [Bacillus canaveralius]|uniref:YppG family protein n=1 Tax=Bacillus canaveralius TaxID=1403243 RepID=UPI00163B57A5|nr:YppG family protein [Bacillus canaveralius]
MFGNRRYMNHDLYLQRRNEARMKPVNPGWNRQQFMQHPYFQQANINPYLQYSGPQIPPMNASGNGYTPYHAPYSQSFYQGNGGTTYVPHQPSFSQMVFQNPLHPIEEMYTANTNYVQQQNPYPGVNPYPKNMFMAKQSSGMKSILNSFKGQDGSLDINKMVNTAGQMMNAVSQVSSMIKGIGGTLKV